MRPAKRGGGMTEVGAGVELICPDRPPLTKIKEADGVVVEILGIDRNQFSQIVMLAQGDFRKLLLAETRERQDIFRKVFQTQYYQTFQKKLKEFVGHTPLQVFAGAVLGIVIALLVDMAY